MQNTPSTAPIARLRGEFSSAATESAFLHQQADTIVRHLSRALALCSLVYILFGATDILALGMPLALNPILARAALAIGVLLALRYVRSAAAPVKAAYLTATVFPICAMASYMVVVCYRPDDILVHGMSTSMLSIVIFVFIPNRLPNAIMLALGTSLAFIALAWYQHMESTRHLISLTLMVLVANVFGMVAGNRHARLWREQYWAQQILTNLSVRDPLTGCYNRRHLNAALLDGEIARARRYRLSLSLIMCDLDGFKTINDTHGHHAGDELLRSFAQLAQAMTRESIDTVVRYGGEEFLIILPETRLAGAVELAERVRAAFAAQRTEVGGLSLGTTASFGVVGAEFGGSHAVTPHGMIALADQLMYEAKHAGRNQVRARQVGQHIEMAERAVYVMGDAA